MDGSEQFGGRLPEVSLLTTRVQPPGALYVAREDRLRVLSWGSAGQEIYITGRLLLPTGEVVPFNFAVITTSDRTYQNNLFGLGEGWLLTLDVADHGATGHVRGMTWVMVMLIRGGLVGGAAMNNLVQGYVSGIDSLSWPVAQPAYSVEGSGRLRSITGTDPAAGVEISEAVPTGARWLLRTWSAVFVTDATVGNRQPRLVIDDGAAILFQSADPSLQAASVTNRYSGGASLAGQTAAVNTHLLALPSELMLYQGWRIYTSTSGLVAGDNWGAPQLLVEEWLEQ